MNNPLQQPQDVDAPQMRQMDIGRRYDDDYAPADGIARRDHALLYALALFMLVFLVWTNVAKLTEVSRGEGKVIPASEVQAIQNLEGGIVDEFLVNDGDEVAAGQVLLRIRNIQARSEYDSANQKYMGLLASMIRLQAEADGKPPVFTQEVIDGAPGAVKAEQDAFDANKKQYDNQLSVLREQRSQKQQEISELERRIADMSRILKLAKAEHDIIAPLAEKGYATKRELLKIDHEIAQQDAELNGLQLSLPRAQAAAKEAGERITLLDASTRAAAQKELAARTTEVNSLRQTLTAYRDRSERTEIKSPLHGIVKDMKITTVGGVARPGETIMEIVPLEDRLIVEARVQPRDIAFIHEGQKAVVRFTAFDFSIYGSLDGKVSEISPDSITTERGESFYRVRVKTDKTALKKGDQEYPIIPGMQATVDIVTGEKTVMNYLLKPFLKSSQTAFKER